MSHLTEPDCIAFSSRFGGSSTAIDLEIGVAWEKKDIPMGPEW